MSKRLTDPKLLAYQINLLSIPNHDVQNIVPLNLRPGANPPRKSHNFHFKINERVDTMVESRYCFCGVVVFFFFESWSFKTSGPVPNWHHWKLWLMELINFVVRVFRYLNSKIKNCVSIVGIWQKTALFIVFVTFVARL